MGHQSYVLLCTETTPFNPPVVQPKSSRDVHLLRSPWLIISQPGGTDYAHYYCPPVVSLSRWEGGSPKDDLINRPYLIKKTTRGGVKIRRF